MYTLYTFAALSSLVLLSAAHPFASPSSSDLESRTCHFDSTNPLTQTAPLSKRQAALTLTSTRPASLRVPLDEVWKHTQDTRPNDLKFANYGYDQIIAGKGKINYCVRWESSKTATAANRADIETAVQRSFKKWVDVLAGYDGFPYSTVDVNVVGWAVSSASKLAGATDGIDVYTTKDGSGAPECDPRCGRFFNQDGDYSDCPAGADRHYDLSLWLTDGFEGGAGGDWGQRVGTDYFLTNVKEDSLHIHLHELGHTFGLDDFYDWTPTGMNKFIMLAGASMVITEFDAWMARDWWTKAIKSRYPNVVGNVATSSPLAIATSVATSSAAFSTSASTVLPNTSTVLATATSTPSTATLKPTGFFPLPTGNSTVQATGFFPTGTGAVGLPTATGGILLPTGSPTPPTGSVAATSTRTRRGRWSKGKTQPTPVVKLEMFNWANA